MRTGRRLELIKSPPQSNSVDLRFQIEQTITVIFNFMTTGQRVIFNLAVYQTPASWGLLRQINYTTIIHSDVFEIQPPVRELLLTELYTISIRTFQHLH